MQAWTGGVGTTSGRRQMAHGRVVALGRGLGLAARLETPQALVRPQALPGRLPLVRLQVAGRLQALPGQHKVTACLCLGNQTIRQIYRRQQPRNISNGTKCGIASRLERRRSGPLQKQKAVVRRTVTGCGWTRSTRSELPRGLRGTLCRSRVALGSSTKLC